MTAMATEVRPFALGDRVTYTNGNVNYAGTVAGLFHSEGVGVDGAREGHEPTEAFIVNPNPDNRPNWAYRPPLGQTGHEYAWAEGITDDDRGIWVSVNNLTPDTTTTEEQHAAALSESAAQITALEAQVSELRATISTAHDVVRIIAEHMKEEAVDRGWCETFESVVDKIDRALPTRGGFDATFTEAAKRDRDFTVRFYGTYTVSATDPDSAHEAFGNLDFGDLRYDVEIDYVEDA